MWPMGPQQQSTDGRCSGSGTKSPLWTQPAPIAGMFLWAWLPFARKKREWIPGSCFCPLGLTVSLLPDLGLSNEDSLDTRWVTPTCPGGLLLYVWEPPELGSSLLWAPCSFRGIFLPLLAPIIPDKVKDAPTRHLFVFPLPLSSHSPELWFSCFDSPIPLSLHWAWLFSSPRGNPNWLQLRAVTGSSTGLPSMLAAWPMTNWHSMIHWDDRSHSNNRIHLIPTSPGRLDTKHNSLL